MLLSKWSVTFHYFETLFIHFSTITLNYLIKIVAAYVSLLKAENYENCRSLKKYFVDSISLCMFFSLRSAFPIASIKLWRAR